MYKWTKSNTYAQRLSGRDGEKIGLTRSISVMPGDKVNIEVYAKYYDPTASNEATFANLMSAIINNIGVPAGTFVDGVGYGQGSSLPFTPGWGAKDGTGAPPMAYLNWMVFDRDYSQDLGRSGYMRITTNAKETGTNATHDKLFSPEITITQPGYVYIWLSNENPTPVEVYFDDFKVTQVKSPVIQQDDYYPYGLTFNSYQRENSVENKRLYNGKELQKELGLSWYDYGWRNYDPQIGRWNHVDPLFQTYPMFTPYQFSSNAPIAAIDRDGLEAEIVINSPYFSNRIQKALDAGDVDKAQQLAWLARVAQRPQGEYAEKVYKGAKTAGTFNWNEKNPNVLTVFDSDGKEIFNVVKQDPPKILEKQEGGFWRQVQEFISGMFDWGVEEGKGDTQEGGIHFFARGANGSSGVRSKSPVKSVDLTYLLAYLSTTKFGPNGPPEMKLEELVNSTISAGKEVDEAIDKFKKKEAALSIKFICPTCKEIYQARDTAEHNEKLKRKAASEDGMGSYKEVPEN